MKATRQQIQEHARVLVSGGVSRRKMDVILRAEYGHSIGKSTYSKLFRERITEVQRREAARPRRGYKKVVNTRQERYNRLITEHFLPPEAKEFSKIRSTKSNDLKVMATQREALWYRFLSKVAREGWDRESKIMSEWQKYVIRWYKRQRFTTGKPGPINLKGLPPNKRLPSPWDYLDNTRKKLPPEMQGESPSKHKRKTQKAPSIYKIEASARINEFRRQKALATNPAEKRRIQRYIDMELSQLGGK